MISLCRSNRSSQSHTPLSSVQSTLLLVGQRLLALLHNLLTLGQDHLDVARVAHVRVDSTVGSVSSTTLFRCLVNLDVLDDQVPGIEAFDVGIGFSVLEE